MCGIVGQFGYCGSRVEADALYAMSGVMHTRGPDGSGTWISADAAVGFAHRRLAILDLSERGAQPMASSDGKLQIVFNGEIYNHPELRAWCEARGARYVSDSDTETLLHLYALEGKRFVERLRGMFAFALWDVRERSLLLARDPFGIKPLYYADDGHSFRFASQVKALLAGGVDDTRDPAGIVSFLLWGYVTDPHTLYRGIRALPAGHRLTLQAGRNPVLQRYADPLDALRNPELSSTEVSSLRDAVLDSVRHHQLADVPVGMFLSAGIDSGTLCALTTECVPAASLRTVTLGFREYAGTADDEVPLARTTASRYGVQHQVIQYGREDFEQERERLLAAMDQPTVDGVNTYFVSKATAATGLKVALSGVGGDELFGGYPSFRQVPRIAHSLRHVPRRMGRVLRVALAPFISRLTSPKYAGLLEYGGSVSGAYLLRRALFMPWEIPALVGRETAVNGLAELDVLNSLDAVTQGIKSPYDQVMALEHAVYLKNCLLRDADWAGMAHGLEIRTPLVDATLFSQIIAQRRGCAPWTKTDFALTPANPLPVGQRNRPKSGFSVPVREWLLARARDSAHKLRGVRGWARWLAESFDIPSESGEVAAINVKRSVV